VATFSIYADERGGAPVWQERQSVSIDDKGRYSVLLGLTEVEGVPAKVFESGAQWLATVFERSGEVEGPRVRITSVPYALRASDAETLGGRPASAYVLAPSTTSKSETTVTTQSQQVTPGTPQPVVLAGTANFVAKYVNTADVGNSAIFESGGSVGIGTTAPLDSLHVRFTNTSGAFTGYAVQNLGNTPTSYSGTLFYDQNGALGQFQGFNNSTHEYRINNVARVSPGGAFNGSINFMIGSASRFFVGSNGGVGIGTTSAGPGLEVSNALTGALVGSMGVSTYGNNAFGGTVVARKARGTQAAPTAVQNGDQIALFAGVGQASAANSGALGNGMEIRAAENFTPATQGTALNFLTTKRGTNTPLAAMTLDDSGNLGLGTTTPGAPLQVVRTGENAGVVSTVYVNGTDSGSFLVPQTARGTAAAPAAVQAGDFLGAVLINGYGTTDFHEAAAVGAFAAENFTDGASGGALGFATTPLGQNDVAIAMALLPSGNLAIGTPLDANGIPTAADKLQVFGDIRVGTTGTNGCLRNFGAGVIGGTCSSDRRFKKGITPFAPVLSKLTALQPVHYYWRAAEFPERHFGNDRTYGLVAQDVEQVLPELVVTNADGYKAVDYSELPLLTIQAVKDLKTENDALKARVAELERLIGDILAASKR
jgi:hypothetical protein